MNDYAEAGEYLVTIVLPSDGDPEEMDRMARDLLVELRDTSVEDARLVTAGEAPAGSKSGEAVMLGNIAVTVLPALLPKLVEFLQAWSLRGEGRRVKFKGKLHGQEIDFEGSPADWKELLAQLNSGPANPPAPQS